MRNTNFINATKRAIAAIPPTHPEAAVQRDFLEQQINMARHVSFTPIRPNVLETIDRQTGNVGMPPPTAPTPEFLAWRKRRDELENMVPKDFTIHEMNINKDFKIQALCQSLPWPFHSPSAACQHPACCTCPWRAVACGGM